MNHLDPAWLHTFVAIAESGALARAALQVNRTASALSVQLRQLESTLDIRLIERSTRRLQLTAEGERFLPYARRLLALQQEAISALAPATAEAAPWRLGFSEYFVPARLQSLLALLQDEARGAPLAVTWARSAELMRQWQAGQLDLAVVSSVEAPPGGVLLRREPLAWVAAPGQHWSPQRPLPLVLLADTCPVREAALAALKRRGMPHMLRLACSGSQAVVTALRAGWGIGCLNHSAVPPDLEMLAERDARRWPSPGRLAFHALASPALAPLVRQLKGWVR